MKVGEIRHIAPRDEVDDSARLWLEILDDNGEPIGEVEVLADSMVSEDRQNIWRAFSYRIDEAPRKAEYLTRYPLSEGEHNRYRVEAEMREDFDDWFLRTRRGRERYAGLDQEAVRRLVSQR